MKRYTQRNAGFTLVELLVVITIIGMLMALLLPAVNAAVEMARAAQCKNNMRNLTVAANSFESAKGRYPGYREYVANKNGGTDADWPSGDDRYKKYYVGPKLGSSTPRGFSWLVPLLPSLDHNDWYDQFATGAKQGPYSELFVCPSDPPTSTSEAFNSYVINAGYWYGSVDGNGKPTGGELENRANGIAHDFAQLPTNAPESGPSVNAEYISGSDGVAYTVMVTENVQDSEWYVGGKELVQTTSGWRVPAVFVWHDSGGATNNRDNPIQQINGRGSQDGSLLDIVVNASGVKANAFRPSSFHTGQVHMSFCDTRTIVISEGIDYVVYQQLMTPSCRESNMSDKNHVLNDNHYR